MTTPITIGANVFSLSKRQRQFRRGEGWFNVETYQGPPNLAEAKESELALLGAEDITSDRGVPCTITAAFAIADPWGGQEQSDAVWELEPFELEKPLATHGNFNQSSGSSVLVLELIEKAIKDGIASNTDWDAVYPNAGEMNAYRDLRIKGVTSYTQWTYVIRKTFSTPREGTMKAAFINVGRIWTYAAIQVPPHVKWEQPSIHSCVELGGGWKDVLLDNWLKYPPRVTYRNLRWEISQEWWGAEKIETVLYDSVVTE